MVKKKNKKIQKQIAKERIEILFSKADEVFDKNKSLANRYVTLARKIAMKYNVRIPKELKRKYCKHCYKYLRPGVNARVRVSRGKVVYKCLECNKISRYPYLKKPSSDRS